MLINSNHSDNFCNKETSMKILALLFLGIIIGLVISTYFTKREVSCLFQSWYEPQSYVCSNKYMERGDKLKLNLKDEHASFYKNCEANYIAQQAIQDDNVVWVYLTKCDFQKEGTFADPITDTFSLRDVEKIQ